MAGNAQANTEIERRGQIRVIPVGCSNTVQGKASRTRPRGAWAPAVKLRLLLNVSDDGGCWPGQKNDEMTGSRRAVGPTMSTIRGIGRKNMAIVMQVWIAL